MTVVAGAAALLASTAGPAAAHIGYGKVPTSLSIRALHSVVPAGSSDVIEGSLHARGHHVAKRPITLLDRTMEDTTWSTLDTEPTDGRGHVAFTVKPTEDTRYRLAYAGERHERASHSGVVTVRVRPVGNLTIAVASDPIRRGQPDSVSGVLTDSSGAAVPGDTVVLLDRHRGDKHRHFDGSAKTDANGAVSFPVSPRQSTAYRLVAKRTTGQARTASPRAVIHVVRPSSLSIRELISPDGTTYSISGVLHGAGRPLAKRAVTLQSSPAGADQWSDVTTVTTNRRGKVDTTGSVPTAATDYRWSYAGGPKFEASVSGVVTAGGSGTTTG